LLGESTSKTHRVYDFCWQSFYINFLRQSFRQGNGPCVVLCSSVLATTYETLAPMFFPRVFPDQVGYLDA